MEVGNFFPYLHVGAEPCIWWGASHIGSASFMFLRKLDAVACSTFSWNSLPLDMLYARSKLKEGPPIVCFDCMLTPLNTNVQPPRSETSEP